MITNKERITNQKQIILDYLKSVNHHPTAEQVYLAVKKKLPRISMATVYRNLKVLAQKGDCQQFSCQRIFRFDGDLSAHYHFICYRCGNIYDLFIKENCLTKVISKAKNIGQVENYQVNLYGICQKCQEKRGKK